MEIKLILFFLNSKVGLDLIRHSAAHILAEAVQSIYPDTKVTIGPVIDDGFYYDFFTEQTFTEADLALFEEKMNEIINKKVSFVPERLTRRDALKTFSEINEKFKIEIINDLPEEEDITIYKQGEWFDLCRGPHAPNSSFIKSFKLLSVAGSYWRGDENRESLQRIYGTAFLIKKI